MSMLFYVKMDVRLPYDMAAEAADKLKKVERERAQELQSAGKWRRLWRITGHARMSAYSTSAGHRSCTTSCPVCCCVHS